MKLSLQVEIELMFLFLCPAAQLDLCQGSDRGVFKMSKFVNSFLAGAVAALPFVSTASDAKAYQVSAERDRPPAISAIGERLHKFIDDREISGAVTLVATPERIVHLGATGSADIGAGKPMRPDTIFWIASM